METQVWPGAELWNQDGLFLGCLGERRRWMPLFMPKGFRHTTRVLGTVWESGALEKGGGLGACGWKREEGKEA